MDSPNSYIIALLILNIISIGLSYRLYFAISKGARKRYNFLLGACVVCTVFFIFVAANALMYLYGLMHNAGIL